MYIISFNSQLIAFFKLLMEKQSPTLLSLITDNYFSEFKTYIIIAFLCNTLFHELFQKVCATKSFSFEGSLLVYFSFTEFVNNI